MYGLQVKIKDGKLYAYSNFLDKTLIKILDDEDVISDVHENIFKWSEVKNRELPDPIAGFGFSYAEKLETLYNISPNAAEEFIKSRSDTEIVSGNQLPQ